MDTLIVGYGKAGKLLHHRCLEKARAVAGNEGLFGRVAGIEASTAIRSQESLELFPSFEAVKGFCPEDTVVHICTPPADRLSVLKEAISRGFSRFIIEKPLALTIREAQEIAKLEQQNRLEMVVVSHWLSSPLVNQAREVILSDSLGKARLISIQHDKPRFTRTLSNSSHECAFDVEMPHEIGLALHLAGRGSRVIGAQCFDMTLGNTVVPFMGGGSLLLSHDSGISSMATSDLMAPVRKRSVSVFLERGSMVLHLPTSGDDNFSSLRMYGESGRLLQTQTSVEDPLAHALSEYYRFFTGQGCRPVSSIDLHNEVTKLLHGAKTLCGLLSTGEAAGSENIVDSSHSRIVSADLRPGTTRLKALPSRRKNKHREPTTQLPIAVEV